MKKSKSDNIFVKVLSLILVGFLLVGVASAAIAISKVETKKIRSSAFAVGAVDENGVCIKDNGSVVTRELQLCRGLTIEPEFEADGTYQVFYYGADKTYIGSTDVMAVSEGEYERGESFPLAKYCRIVITPEVPTDDSGIAEENFKIKSYQVRKYAKRYTITVNKNQSFRYELSSNLFNGKDTAVGQSFDGSVGNPLDWNINTVVSTPGLMVLSHPIELGTKVDTVDMFVKVTSDVKYNAYLVAADADGDVITSDAAKLSVKNEYTLGDWAMLSIDLSEIKDAKYVNIVVPDIAEVQIFAYKR